MTDNGAGARGLGSLYPPDEHPGPDAYSEARAAAWRAAVEACAAKLQHARQTIAGQPRDLNKGDLIALERAIRALAPAAGEGEGR